MRIPSGVASRCAWLVVADNLPGDGHRASRTVYVRARLSQRTSTGDRVSNLLMLLAVPVTRCPLTPKAERASSPSRWTTSSACRRRRTAACRATPVVLAQASAAAPRYHCCLRWHDALVFTTANGRPHDRRNLLRAVRLAGNRVGLSGEGGQPVGLHELRHSFVAIALANGVTLPEHAMLALHTSPRVTLAVDAAPRMMPGRWRWASHSPARKISAVSGAFALRRCGDNEGATGRAWLPERPFPLSFT
jgi:hypothetical protein